MSKMVGFWQVSHMMNKKKVHPYMETAEKYQGTPDGHVEANHMRLSVGTWGLTKQKNG